MTTFVTGGSGFLGNNVVRLLLARGQAVRVLVRAGSSSQPFDGLAVEKVPGDVCDAASIQRAMAGAEKVIHCAGMVHIGWTGLAEQRAINVEGTRHVAEAALQQGARLVHVSSIDALAVRSLDNPVDENTPVDGEVPCPYVITKREAEQVVLECVARGLNGVIVNPGFMLGPWDWKPSSGRMLLKISSGWAMLAPPGTNSYCDVRDVAAGILAALERGRTGQRYILAGQTLTYRKALKILAPTTGSRPPIRTAIQPTIKLIGRAGDLLTWITGHESDVNSAATAMSLLPKNYSSAKAAAELGYHTRSLDQSASDAWQWLKQHGYVKK
ncbi:MAG TPA: NAD-dependent epimerase/dehydratase family protein [Pirellulales bacterium]|jgi:dihydroflavonol-4-reductase|nr:NAD-dependent epimerase/dehydratase family protein [Pirellulales bacterium]